ncbi:MAG: NUDIX domain-containing protein [Pseudomonadales bacterium]
MIFCTACGGETRSQIPDGDHRERRVCANCEHINYENPKVIVSCLAHCENKLVWVKRAEEPRRGYWVIPAGYLERDESLGQGAARELYEETNLPVRYDTMALYTLGTLRYTNEVYVVFRAELESVAYQANHEILEVGLFDESNAPWDDLAYPVVESYIRRFYSELKDQKFSPYIGDFSEAGNVVWDIT